MAVHHELGQTKNFATEMEGIAETRLLTLLRGECFNRFQIEVIVQMKVIEIFSMNEQIQHVVALPANLQAYFNPIKSGRLEKLGRLERAE